MELLMRRLLGACCGSFLLRREEQWEGLNSPLAVLLAEIDFGHLLGICFLKFHDHQRQGRKGVFRVDEDRTVTQVVSGPGIVGLAFLPSGDMAITTSNSVYRLSTANWISN